MIEHRLAADSRANVVTAAAAIAAFGASMLAAAVDPIWALAAIALLAVSLVAYARPTVAAGIAIALVWWGLPDLALKWGGVATAFSILPFVLLIGAHGGRLAIHSHLARTRTCGAALCAWMAVGLTTLLWAARPAAASESLRAFVVAAILAWLVALGLGSSRDLRAAFWGLIASSAFVAAAHLAALLGGVTGVALGGLVQFQAASDHLRLAGSVGDPNRAGQLLVVAVPLAIDRLAGEERRSLRLAAFIALLLVSWAVLRTLSRADAVALVAAGAACLIYHRRSRAAKVAAIVGALVAMLAFPRQLAERVRVTVAEVAGGALATDPSALSRAPWLRDAWSMLLEHPVLGSGVGALDGSHRSEVEHGSLYLEIGAETGFIGLSVFTAIVLATVGGLRAEHRRRRERGATGQAAASAALGFALGGYLVAALLLRGAWRLDLWLLVASCLASTATRTPLLASPFSRTAPSRRAGAFARATNGG